MLLTPFLLEFSSWHWPGDFDFADQRLRDAWDAMRPPTTGEAFEQGFLTLLRSGDAVAEGIGLDFYDRAEMTERYVGGNVLERHAEEVFAVARRALARPPRPGDEHPIPRVAIRSGPGGAGRTRWRSPSGSRIRTRP
ncbi:hypothetical protein, partial [Nonomuraea sp. NPDC050643]|uniref:hypothetical protein n=1 Tax=Nonomuraea sp. NPDC050643 TaxID=3155660 RepID=UPI0033EF6948